MGHNGSKISSRSGRRDYASTIVSKMKQKHVARTGRQGDVPRSAAGGDASPTTTIYSRIAPQTSSSPHTIHGSFETQNDDSHPAAIPNDSLDTTIRLPRVQNVHQSLASTSADEIGEPSHKPFADYSKGRLSPSDSAKTKESCHLQLQQTTIASLDLANVDLRRIAATQRTIDAERRKRRCNLARLPCELLIAIVDLTMEGEPIHVMPTISDKHMRSRRMALGQVCRSLRKIIHDTPVQPTDDAIYHFSSPQSVQYVPLLREWLMLPVAVNVMKVNFSVRGGEFDAILVQLPKWRKALNLCPNLERVFLTWDMTRQQFHDMKYSLELARISTALRSRVDKVLIVDKMRAEYTEKGVSIKVGLCYA